MNPIENEAVINSVVTQLDGSVEIVDCTDQFPQLNRSPGLVECPFFGSDLGLIETPDG
jgi:hypothetical protein